MKRGSYTHKLTLGAAMLAFGIILPQLFHLTGIPQAGEIFLPMHIPVLLAGFLTGGAYGAAVGIFAPLISSILTGMPAAPRLPFMIAELAAYGLVSGLLYHNCGLKSKKFGSAVTLVSAMLAGRAFYAAMLWIAANAFHIDCGGAMAAVTATVKGIYGIGLQILVIPPLVYAAKKGGFIIEKNRKSQDDADR